MGLARQGQAGAGSGGPGRNARFKKDRGRSPGSDQKGAILVVSAMALMIILGIAGLAVDLAHLYVLKCELQRAADAGAMAGARSIFPFPLSSATSPLNPNCAAALAKGQEIAQVNLVDGGSPTVGTLQTGSWNWNASQFTPGCSANPFSNAVALTARKDNISLLLMGLLGFGPYTLSASSVAVMDFVGSFKPGGAFVMFLGKKYVQKGTVTINLNPDAVDAGGWYTKAPQTPNNSTISGYLANPAAIPAIQQGDMVNINNGVWSGVLATLKSSYIGKTVWLPVVDTVKYNQSGPVEGFTAFTITEVKTTGHQYVRGTAETLRDAPGSVSEPGGSSFGLLTPTRLVR